MDSKENSKEGDRVTARGLDNMGFEGLMTHTCPILRCGFAL
jgi:hypothetical protein